MTAPGLPQINTPQVAGSSYKVRDRNPQKIAPTTWRVGLTFGIPTNGDYTVPDPDPRNRPKRLLWGRSITSNPMDHDAVRNAVRNSSGDYFDPLPEQDLRAETLAVRWTTDFYNRELANGYFDRTNSDSITIDSSMFYPGEILCTGYQPDGEYPVGTQVIPMIATFEMQKDARAANNTPGYPWDAHLTDKGTTAWLKDNLDGNKLKRGFFCVTTTIGGVERVASVITQPILLDGKGKPLAITGQADIKATDLPDGTGRVFTPADSPFSYWIITNPQALNYNASPFDTPQFPGTPRIFRFRRKQSVPFNGIV